MRQFESLYNFKPIDERRDWMKLVKGYISGDDFQPVYNGPFRLPALDHIGIMFDSPMNFGKNDPRIIGLSWHRHSKPDVDNEGINPFL